MDQFDGQSYKMDRERHDCGQAQLAPPALLMSVPTFFLTTAMKRSIINE